MTRQIRAELLKVFSTRMVWALLATVAAFVLLNVVAGVFAAGQQGAPPLSDPATVKGIWGAAGSAEVLVLILGILGMTTEFRHQTITATFLATPRRPRVLVPKMVAHGIIGFGFAVAAVALVAVSAPPLLGLRHAATLDAATVAKILSGAVLATVLYGVLGVSVGALIRNQVAAIVAALVWVLLAESLLVAFLPAVGKWLPGGAASALLQTGTLRGGDLLSPAAGAALMLAYAVAFALIAIRVTLRRDVT